MRRPRTIAALAAIAMLVPAAAMAHPSFNPNEVATGTATDAVLVIPHSCGLHGGMPDGDDALPTIEFALQLADGVTVEPGDVDGWDTSVADDAVTWTDAGGATTDVIEFPVTITVAPDAGPEFALTAFQQCEDDQFIRWTADDADFPAVHLVVEGAGSGSSHDQSENPDEPVDDASDMDGHDDMTDDGHDDMTGDHGEGASDAETGDPLPAGAQALAGEQADSGPMILAIAIAAILVVLLAAGLVAGRREQ